MLMEYNNRFLACCFHLSSNEWVDPEAIPNHVYIRWIREKWREWLTMNTRFVHDRISPEDHKRFDEWLRLLPRLVVFIDEKYFAPELELGKTYMANRFDGQLLDIYASDKRIVGTYYVERFRPI
jgi:hypothetical protein